MSENFAIQNHAAANQTMAIIGLGYVGLPLAVAFAHKRSVIGFDINASRISDLLNGIDKTLQCSEQELAQVNALQTLQFTNDVKYIEDCTIYIITVPTPVDENKQPDLSILLEASKMIGGILKKGDLVIYESTVYPGCTEEDCVPELEKNSGLKFNEDFFVGYSPERMNPGDKINTITQIVKVTSGSTPLIAQQVNTLYQSIITAGTHQAPSIKVAEAAKSIENAQRDINISFVNELALMFDKMGIDTYDVLEAAATKWNFLPFKPGLVGGHCIGVDPYYLAHKAMNVGYHPQVILSGRSVNDQMSHFIAQKINKLLMQQGFTAIGAKVLLLGVTFKENCPDIRNSKVFEIVQELQQMGMDVSVFDPFANAQEVMTTHHIQLITELHQYDAIVLTVAHDFFKSLNYASLKTNSNAVIYDTKALLDKSIVTARL
ncbi:MAG: nucleotide sugar dehydrogenase [Chitinophagia bacterium]|jgi:UDP-N-acetyl-D-glucosamine/UDP-N-acetyl-D-galactosamine dehydrogenase|nr:nucleotide sugar dehydrogenase [Chitinophagia bacterium]